MRRTHAQGRRPLRFFTIVSGIVIVPGKTRSTRLVPLSHGPFDA